MFNILIKTDSHYKVNRKRVRNLVVNFLNEKKLKGKTEVSITIIGDRQMKELNSKFRKLDETTDVLSFPLGEQTAKGLFIDYPDDILRLGDIVISYPQAVLTATEEQKLVDDVIDSLVIHGLNHLMGIHHE